MGFLMMMAVIMKSIDRYAQLQPFHQQRLSAERQKDRDTETVS